MTGFMIGEGIFDIFRVRRWFYVNELYVNAPIGVESICPDKKKNNIKNFLSIIDPKIGEKILLVGKVSFYGKYLKKSGADVTILEETKDYSKSAIIQNINCNVVEGSPEYMPFKDDYFKKVIFLNHFNSFEDEKRIFGEINRVLEDSGQIIIEEKNPNGIFTKCEIFKNKVLGNVCKYYSPDELEQIFESRGISGKIKKIGKERYLYIGNKIERD